ncbi:MAG: NAD-binding protein [Solirubrobacterales bacterium]|nr:NAD-binding protein [Solirubrobacterales bacterium]
MRVLLVGPGDLADEVEAALEAEQAEVVRLGEPEHEELAVALADGPWDRVTVVTRSDAVALRLALSIRREEPELPMLVTIFDHTAAEQLRAADEHVEVTSLAEIVAPSLAGPCVEEGLAALRVGEDGAVAIRTEDGTVREEPFSPRQQSTRVFGLLTSLARPYDRSAALLVYGALGILTVLVVETIGAMIAIDQGFVDALYGSAKTLASVDANQPVADGPASFKMITTVAMLVGLFFEALFTAGLVNRLIDRRLTAWVGRRSVPREHHVVVVGLGKVGLRLCQLLRAAGVRVVGVDVEEDGEYVGRAKEDGIAVVIGRGADPSLLRRLSLPRASALAAVTADDLENLSIAMTARSIAPDLRIVLRAEEAHLADQTRSFLGLGVVRDIHQIAAALLAARSTGSSAQSVLSHEDEAHLVHDGGRLERAAVLGAEDAG